MDFRPIDAHYMHKLLTESGFISARLRDGLVSDYTCGAVYRVLG